jgi:DNA-binding transcriptional MerR regulator
MKSQLSKFLTNLKALDLSGAAEYLGVHPNTLKNYEKRGILMPSYRLSVRKDRRYIIEDLNKFRRENFGKLKK